MLHRDLYTSLLHGFLSRIPVQVSYNLHVSSILPTSLSTFLVYSPVNVSSLVGNTKFCVLTTFLRNGIECARVVVLLKLGAK